MGKRPYTEAQGRATAKYRAKAYDRIEVKARKEEGRLIRSAAEAAGQSVNAYILDAVRQRMERDGVSDTIV